MAITIRQRSVPEPVHEVEVRTEGRKGIRGAADQSSKDPVTLKSFDPKGKGRFGQTFREEEKKKEKRAQDLWLIPGRPSSGREKGEKKRYGDIGIEKAELLPGLPKLGM